MLFYKSLEIRASDENPDPDMVEQARMKLAVLRRLFAGGLLTEARVRKHKRHAEISICSCGLGEEDTVEHASWRCTKYQAIRAPLLRKLPQQGRNLPVITKHAALILKTSRLTSDQIQCLQETLVTIWQQHIRSFYAEDVNDVPPSAPIPSSGNSQQNASIRQANGHALAMLPSGGMWCRKCGKQCARLQHIKLKNTKNPCPHANEDESQWLDTPGFNFSSHRLDQLQEELETKYNKGGHMLTWNCQIGKVYNAPNEGLIQCSRCTRQWRWQDRVNNLPRSKCIPDSPPQSSNHRNQFLTPAPKFRLHGKQTPQSNRFSSETSPVPMQLRPVQHTAQALAERNVQWSLGTCVSFTLTRPRIWDPAGFTADGHCEIHLLGEGMALPSVMVSSFHDAKYFTVLDSSIALLHAHLSQIACFVVWSLSAKCKNRLMHALCGNGSEKAETPQELKNWFVAFLPEISGSLLYDTLKHDCGLVMIRKIRETLQMKMKKQANDEKGNEQQTSSSSTKPKEKAMAKTGSAAVDDWYVVSRKKLQKDLSDLQLRGHEWNLPVLTATQVFLQQ